MHRSPSTMGFSMAAAALLVVAIPAASQEEACLTCHQNAALFTEVEGGSRLVVRREDYAVSVHSALGLECSSCHEGVAVPHMASMQSVNCGICHGAAQDAFEAGLHGYALRHGNPRAPVCADCHGTHDVRASVQEESRTNRLRLPHTCGACHGGDEPLAVDGVRLAQPLASYSVSVHGVAISRGDEDAAVCTDCHGVHLVQAPSDPTSPTNPASLSATCGQCHETAQAEYEQSIHSQAVLAGVNDGPTCDGCHGVHLILPVGDVGAAAWGATLASEMCRDCHDDPEIVAKFGLRGGVVGSYSESYHGWTARGGYDRAASCHDCHGAHAVLPASNPASTVHETRVVETCRQYHAGATLRFAASCTREAVALATNTVSAVIRSHLSSADRGH